MSDLYGRNGGENEEAGSREIPENTTRMELHFSSEWAEKNGIKLTKPGILENRIKDWIIHQFTDNIPGIKASFIASGDGSFIVFVSSENGSLPSDELQDLVDEGYANGAEILAFKGEPSVP